MSECNLNPDLDLDLICSVSACGQKGDWRAQIGELQRERRSFFSRLGLEGGGFLN